MSMKKLEKEVLAEVKKVTGNQRLKMKNIAEWSTSESSIDKNIQAGEKKIHCPELNVWCAVILE